MAEQKSWDDVVTIIQAWARRGGMDPRTTAAALASVPGTRSDTIAFPRIAPGGNITVDLANAWNQEGTDATKALDYTMAIATATGRYLSALQMGDQPSANLQKRWITYWLDILGAVMFNLSADETRLATVLRGTAYDISWTLADVQSVLNDPCGCKPASFPQTMRDFFTMYGLDPQDMLNWMPPVNPNSVALSAIAVINSMASLHAQIATILQGP